MVKRRSLNDALTPEEEAFLKQKKSNKSQSPKPKPKPKIKKESQPMERTESHDQSSAASSPVQHTVVGTGSINAGFDPTITTALIRASVERRIAGQTPSTHRDIIAEGLSDRQAAREISESLCARQRPRSCLARDWRPQPACRPSRRRHELGGIRHRKPARRRAAANPRQLLPNLCGCGN